MHAYGNAATKEVGSEENKNNADHGESQQAACCNEIKQQASFRRVRIGNATLHNTVQTETHFSR